MDAGLYQVGREEVPGRKKIMMSSTNRFGSRGVFNKTIRAGKSKHKLKLVYVEVNSVFIWRFTVRRILSDRISLLVQMVLIVI